MNWEQRKLRSRNESAIGYESNESRRQPSEFKTQGRDYLSLRGRRDFSGNSTNNYSHPGINNELHGRYRSRIDPATSYSIKEPVQPSIHTANSFHGDGRDVYDDIQYSDSRNHNTHTHKAGRVDGSSTFKTPFRYQAESSNSNMKQRAFISPLLETLESTKYFPRDHGNTDIRLSDDPTAFENDPHEKSHQGNADHTVYQHPGNKTMTIPVPPRPSLAGATKYHRGQEPQLPSLAELEAYTLNDASVASVNSTNFQGSYANYSSEPHNRFISEQHQDGRPVNESYEQEDNETAGSKGWNELAGILWGSLKPSGGPPEPDEQFRALKAALAQRDLAIEDYEKRLHSKERKIDRLEGRIDSLTNSLQEANEAYDKQAIELESQRAQFHDVRATLLKRIEMVDNEREQQELALSQINFELEEKHRQLVLTQSMVLDNRRQLRDSERRFKSLEVRWLFSKCTRQKFLAVRVDNGRSEPVVLCLSMSGQGTLSLRVSSEISFIDFDLSRILGATLKPCQHGSPARLTIDVDLAVTLEFDITNGPAAVQCYELIRGVLELISSSKGGLAVKAAAVTSELSSFFFGSPQLAKQIDTAKRENSSLSPALLRGTAYQGTPLHGPKHERSHENNSFRYRDKSAAAQGPQLMHSSFVADGSSTDSIQSMSYNVRRSFGSPQDLYRKQVVKDNEVSMPTAQKSLGRTGAVKPFKSSHGYQEPHPRVISLTEKAHLFGDPRRFDIETLGEVLHKYKHGPVKKKSNASFDIQEPSVGNPLDYQDRLKFSKPLHYSVKNYTSTSSQAEDVTDKYISDNWSDRQRHSRRLRYDNKAMPGDPQLSSRQGASTRQGSSTRQGASNRQGSYGARAQPMRDEKKLGETPVQTPHQKRFAMSGPAHKSNLNKFVVSNASSRPIYIRAPVQPIRAAIEELEEVPGGNLKNSFTLTKDALVGLDSGPSGPAKAAKEPLEKLEQQLIEVHGLNGSSSSSGSIEGVYPQADLLADDAPNDSPSSSTPLSNGRIVLPLLENSKDEEKLAQKISSIVPSAGKTEEGDENPSPPSRQSGMASVNLSSIEAPAELQREFSTRRSFEKMGGGLHSVQSLEMLQLPKKPSSGHDATGFASESDVMRKETNDEISNLMKASDMQINLDDLKSYDEDSDDSDTVQILDTLKRFAS